MNAYYLGLGVVVPLHGRFLLCLPAILFATMALSKFNSRALAQAQAHLKTKARRRRLVRLSSSRHRQPRIRTLPLSKHQTKQTISNMSSENGKHPPSQSAKSTIEPSFKLQSSSTSTSDDEKLTTKDKKLKSKLKSSPTTQKDKNNQKHSVFSFQDHCPADDRSSLSEDETAQHHNAVKASVQRLHIPSDDAVPCKSTAKRKLDELLKDPLVFVRATKATMSTEPARQRRRLISSEMAQRSRAISHLSRDFSRPDLGAVGLVNDDGRSCYRRSSLQILMNIPIFVHWIKTHNGCSKRHCIACALRVLADAYWPDHGGQNRGNISTAVRRFDRVVNVYSDCPGFATRFSEEECAHEFLMFLLSHLSPQGGEVPAMLRDEFEALFCLKARWQRTCQRCGYTDQSNPDMAEGHTINIIPRGKNFVDYFDNLFNEVLDADRNIRCEQCSGLNHARTNVVFDGPEILTVQIARFTWEGRGRKITDAVPFPLYLDLSRYLEDERMQRPGTLRYRLSSVLQQAGTLHGGHYITKAVTPRGIQQANDESVSQPLAINDLLRARDNSFTPYILTYVRVRK